MNRKLYYEDQYLKECTSNITDIIKKEEKVFIVLDNSPFYPAGGGQPNDLGWIDNEKVIDVYEDKNIVYNQVLNVPDTKEVKCIIDFNRRFDLMQQHTGEHLLSAAFLKKYNGVNCGFRLGDEYTTIDIDLPEVTLDMIMDVENEANNYIYKNIDINTYFVERDEVEVLPLRSKIKVSDDIIRIVNIEGIDMCACCGTHLKSTGEVGIIKINKVERHKGMSRIYFKCGKRALEDYDNKQEIISKLIKISASEENKLIDRLIFLNEKISNLTKNLIYYKKKVAGLEAECLLSDCKNEIIFKVYQNKGFDELQMISEEIIKQNIVFIGLSEIDKKIIALHNGFSDINFGNIFKLYIKMYNGKGGGDTKRAQGTFNSIDELRRFADLIVKEASGT